VNKKVLKSKFSLNNRINNIGGEMKRVNIVVLAVLCLLLSSMSYGRTIDGNLRKIEKRKNSIGLLIGGTGLFASFNYGRIILVKPNYFINLSVGIGSVPFAGGITFPHQVTFNLGKKSSFFELGIGGSYWSGKTNESGYTETFKSYQLTPVIGWRKHFNSNLIFRIYANLLFRVSGEYFIENYPVIPFVGLSLGYGF